MESSVGFWLEACNELKQYDLLQSIEVQTVNPQGVSSGYLRAF